MNELQIFKNEQFGEVRTVEVDGEPWFLGKDIAKALGYADINKAVAMHVDECDRKSLRRKDYDKTCVTFWDSENDLKNKIVINESGVYSLIMESNLESAKAFKRWITHEVIPSIRKHGAYATPDTLERMLNDPDSMIKVLTALKEEREARKALESKAEADKPKVMFAEAVSAAAGSIGIGDMAKILKKNGVDIGRTRFFSWLRKNGYLMQSGTNTVPTQKAMDMGLFEVCETVIQSPDKEPFVRLTTKVTGKGQEYFLKRVTADDALTKLGRTNQRMTAREWVRKNHPKCVSKSYGGGVYGCPHDYPDIAIQDFPECNEGGDRCTECWDRYLVEVTE